MFARAIVLAAMWLSVGIAAACIGGWPGACVAVAGFFMAARLSTGSL